MIPTLTTKRLLLRAPEMDDAQRIATFLDNFAVSGNLARVPHPYRLSDAKAWLRTRRGDLPPDETNFGIEFESEGYVGQVGFHAGRGGETIVGYWLAEPYWGRGIMTEALEATLDWFFSTTTAEKVDSGVFADVLLRRFRYRNGDALHASLCAGTFGKQPPPLTQNPFAIISATGLRAALRRAVFICNRCSRLASQRKPRSPCPPNLGHGATGRETKVRPLIKGAG